MPALLTRMSNGAAAATALRTASTSRDVERQRFGLLAAGADRVGAFLDFDLGARGQRHMRAGIGQRRGGGQARCRARRR